MKRIAAMAGVILALATTAAFAQDLSTLGARTGLGQDSPKSPAQLANLRLNDPVVQQKYLNEPDMLRFLRGTYSEACARGLVNQAAKQVKFDTKSQYTPEARAAAAQMMENNRIWKMTSFEMEAMFGSGYLNAANYCDCVMKEVSDADIVDPRKGLEVVEKLSKPAQASCERVAKEQTERQMAKRKSAAK